MSTTILSLADQLSNQDVVARVKVLAQREREATAALIAHLAVLHERQLYRAEGRASMFTYCVQVLHLSEYAAYSRIEAAKAARKYPIILDLLGDGSVNLTTVGLLIPELRPENHVALLGAARHKTKRQVQELVAQRRPQPSVPSTIRRLPTPRPAAETLGTDDLPPLSPALSPDAALSTTADAPARAEAPAPALAERQPQARGSLIARRPVIVPLGPHRYKVQFTASAETHAKLLRAQELLRSQIPGGDVGEIIDRALTVLLKDLSKRKFAATDRPRESSSGRTQGSHDPVPRTRCIPAKVKRTVWKRDSGQCAFVAPNGRRCTERVFLEFHHVAPYSAGGEATVENIQLRCRAHNGFEAELVFGRRTYRPRSTGDDQSMMTSSTGSGPSNRVASGKILAAQPP
ncbi:MAG: HNH endonuclease [bacterium]